jgi:hypothetical protein
MMRLSDTTLKGYHFRTITAKFGLMLLRSFGEDLNVKSLQWKNDGCQELAKVPHMLFGLQSYK